MALKGVLRTIAGGRVAFYCKGCKELHAVNVSGEGKPGWTFNGNHDKPTFTPSVLVRSGHYLPGHKNMSCWCTYYKEHPEEKDDDGFKCTCCHSFVTDGQIQYLSDCSHELAGQTIPLEPPPDNAD